MTQPRLENRKQAGAETTIHQQVLHTSKVWIYENMKKASVVCLFACFFLLCCICWACQNETKCLHLFILQYRHLCCTAHSDSIFFWCQHTKKNMHGGGGLACKLKRSQAWPWPGRFLTRQCSWVQSVYTDLWYWQKEVSSLSTSCLTCVIY